ncbi:P-loop containing nucleoside triphosphate hydrolase protein [Xylariaceae sp. FL1272]|nr:P-loop containing nucleoside triphosphate hydrolase protein [Xylariaceae sp. FL1272]
MLGIVVDCILTAVLLVLRKYGVGIASPLVSAYLLALALLRDHRYGSRTHLDTHSSILYSLQALSIITITHSAFIKGLDNVTRIAQLMRLVLFLGLITIHGFAPRVETQQRDDNNPGSEENRASFFFRLTFPWANGLLWNAYRAGPLEKEDLGPLSYEQRSPFVVSFYDHNSTATLPWNVFQFIKWDILQQGAWAAVTSVFVFVPPFLLKIILEYLDDMEYPSKNHDIWNAVAGILVAALMAGVTESQCGWKGNNISATVRNLLLNLIHDKLLRRANIKMGAHSTTDEGEAADDGRIINMVSADVDSISFISGSLYLVWVTFPVQITIGTLLLYRILDWSGVFGVILMIALLPLNVRLSKHFAAIQRRVLVASDARIQISNEVLRTMRTRFIWWSINITVFFSLPFIATLITFLLFIAVWGNELKTTTAFPALAAFAVLRIPLNRLADSITFLLQTHVSLRRIESFLHEHDCNKYAQTSNTPEVSFKNTTLTWPTGQDTSASTSAVGVPTGDLSSNHAFALSGLTVTSKCPGLNVVCGPSGSGKSSLLLGLLGEMQLREGQQRFPISDCGQKQRVALARALYSRADYLLFDDCLSAVDSQTARRIFHNAIRGHSTGHRTCIFATHHLRLALTNCDHVVALANDQIKAQGTPESVMATVCLDKALDDSRALVHDREESESDIRIASTVDRDETISSDAVAEAELKEKKLVGAVPWSIVRYYLQNMGHILFWSLVLCEFAVQQLAALSTNIWVKHWALDMITLSGSFRASSKVYEQLLKGINFEARPGQRIAIVGRTGACKSSLVLALLRALEPDDGGSIEIDGIEIATVPVSRLRGEAVTVVPQDLQLFDGSVPEKLSRAQRQLLSVSRGLLRRTCVLVLYEATASIDHATDRAIQQDLRPDAAASNTTVITIAHRLLTIADYDRVIVLDPGRIVKEGSVEELVKDEGHGGVFRRLCMESGDMEAIVRAAQK